MHWFRSLFIFFVSIAILSFCGVIFIRFQNVDAIQSRQTIDNENATLENPDTITYREYYLFNVLNPKEIALGEKPILEERGPYVYREETKRYQEKYLDNDRLSYSTITTLYPEPSLSGASLSDQITFLNIPAMGMIQSSNIFSQFLFNTILAHFDLFYTKTAEELISGYKDPLLEKAKRFKSDINEIFSLFKENATISDNYVISNKEYKIESWNNLDKLNYWTTEWANQINGTDGSEFAPNLKQKNPLYMFRPEICRSIRLEYLERRKINGNLTLEYHLPQNAFFKPESNPKNEGFCGNKDCLADGVQTLAPCSEDMPIFASLPHCLYCDQELVDSVVGLKPVVEEHSFKLNIEPTTGHIWESQITYQANFYLQKHDYFDMVKKVKNVLLPLFWYRSRTRLI